MLISNSCNTSCCKFFCGCSGIITSVLHKSDRLEHSLLILAPAPANPRASDVWLQKLYLQSLSLFIPKASAPHQVPGARGIGVGGMWQPGGQPVHAWCGWSRLLSAKISLISQVYCSSSRQVLVRGWVQKKSDLLKKKKEIWVCNTLPP